MRGRCVCVFGYTQVEVEFRACIHVCEWRRFANFGIHYMFKLTCTRYAFVNCNCVVVYNYYFCFPCNSLNVHSRFNGVNQDNRRYLCDEQHDNVDNNLTFSRLGAPLAFNWPNYTAQFKPHARVRGRHHTRSQFISHIRTGNFRCLSDFIILLEREREAGGGAYELAKDELYMFSISMEKNSLR